MGSRARQWVSRKECNWSSVAARYVDFWTRLYCPPLCLSVPDHRQNFLWGTGRPRLQSPAPFDPATEPANLRPRPSPPSQSSPEAVAASVASWVAPEGRAYAAEHKSRFVHTLEITPPGGASKSILEMGSYMQITAPLKFQLGYGSVRGCYYGPLGRIDHKTITSESGRSLPGMRHRPLRRRKKTAFPTLTPPSTRCSAAN